MAARLNFYDYTVAWIAPLRIEAEAALRVLDRRHDGYFVSNDADDYTYRAGEINGHYIVITTLNSGQNYGPNSAAAIVNQVKSRFPRIRFALLVGVAAGLPNLSTTDEERHRDIRLGDVLVAIPDKLETGIVHYDLGKETGNGFERVGRQAEPPSIILSAITWIQAEESNPFRHGNSLAKYLVAMQESDGGTSFECPSQDDDQLFSISKHRFMPPTRISRPRRSENERTRVWYGTIGSGNLLMKEPRRRDELRDQYNLIGLEMEAAGITKSIPTGVIRGVSDYGDGYKTKLWQPYAAAVAAVYAKGILRHVTYGENVAKSTFVQAPDTSLRNLQDIQDRIELKLVYAAGAEFNDYGVTHEVCLPGTRVEILDQMRDWARATQGKRIFWLNGMAGTGKSTISRTIAEWLHASTYEKSTVQLGGSFFFKRGSGEQASALRFFPTVVRQLTHRIPALAPLVMSVLESEPGICGKLLGEQFDKLLYRPLQQLEISAHGRPIFVVVVDALDEGDNMDDMCAIPKLWSRLSNLESISLKLLVTSRPELPLRLQFDELSSYVKNDIVLHEIPLQVIEHDIDIYLRFHLAKIRHGNASVPRDWPGEPAIRALVSKANPLFISAATICRFLYSRNHRPQQQLEKILTQTSYSRMSQVDLIYITVLDQVSVYFHEDKDGAELLTEFRTIVGSILVIGEPLSVVALADLLDLVPDDVDLRLSQLHSVLSIPKNPHEVVRVLHLSFRDFLLGTSIRDRPYSIDEVEVHRMLLSRCLKVMTDEKGLKQDICGLNRPGILQSDIDIRLTREHIRADLSYACCYWTYHIGRSQTQVRNGDEVHDFLKNHFLHWLEALSLLNKLRVVVDAFQNIENSLLENSSGEVAAFLADARRFFLAHRGMFATAPLQLYSASLVATPPTSVVRSSHGKVPLWLVRYPVTLTAWTNELLQLQGLKGEVMTLSFSPDGLILATASKTGYVQLWEVSTGQELVCLQVGSDPRYKSRALAFSSDGRLFATTADDGNIGLWEVSTGEALFELKGHEDMSEALAFSPNGGFLASGSRDETIRLWKVKTGEELARLRGQTNFISHIRFAPDGRSLAFVGSEGKVRIWNFETDMAGHKERIAITGTNGNGKHALAFTGDGELLVYRFHDRDCRIKNVNTGITEQVMANPSSSCTSASFEAAGQALAVALGNHDIRIWYRTRRDQMRRLEGHTETINDMVFHPTDKYLASSSADMTVRLWGYGVDQDAVHSNSAEKSSHTKGQRIKTITISADARVVAANQVDGTVQLWDVETGLRRQGTNFVASTGGETAFSHRSDILAIYNKPRAGVNLWKLDVSSQEADAGLSLLPLDESVRGNITSLAFSLDDTFLAIDFQDDAIVVWNTTTGRLHKTFPLHVYVRPIVVASTGEFIGVGQNSGRVRFLDIHGEAWETEVVTTNCATGGIDFTCLALSPDDKFIATATLDTVQVRGVRSSGFLHTFWIAGVKRMAFSMDGRSLVTNVGIISIDGNLGLGKPGTLNKGNTITVKDDWIEQRGESVLWLPPEYRRLPMAMRDNILAVGVRSGDVHFFEFDYRPPQQPQQQQEKTSGKKWYETMVDDAFDYIDAYDWMPPEGGFWG